MIKYPRVCGCTGEERFSRFMSDHAAVRPTVGPVTNLPLPAPCTMRLVLPTTYARTRIYRPHREAVPRERLFNADLTDVQVHTGDGLTLNGWYALSRMPSDSPRPQILYFPGTTGHRGYRIVALEMLTRLGCDVLLVDYRGYGDNPGRPSERNQNHDAHAVWNFAMERLHAPPERIVIYGESIGGGVGTRLAAELCREGTIPGGLILQSTFTSMLDVIAQFFPRWLAATFLVDRYRSLRHIRHVTCPLLSMHGDDDRLIPINMGRRLFDAAPTMSVQGRRKQFLELPGVDHGDVLEEAGGQVQQALARFLRQAVPPQEAEQTVSISESSSLVQPLP